MDVSVIVLPCTRIYNMLFFAGLWIYCVPVSKHCTLLIINSGGRVSRRWQDQLLGRIPFMRDFTR